MARFVFYDPPPEADEEIVRLRWQISRNRVLLAAYRLEALLAKANFNPNEARVPQGNGRESGRWTREGGRSSGSDGDGSRTTARVGDRDRAVHVQPIAQRTGLIQWESNPESAYWASPGFVARFSGSAEEVKVAATIVQIDAGNHPIYEVLTARQLQLPGGEKTSYDVYSVGQPTSGRGRERIARLPGTNVYYYSPYHYKPGPGVPNGWIRLKYPATNRSGHI